MENLDPLRQKPDFEQIASFRADITDHGMFLGFTAGCEHVWTSHVEPLMKELEGRDKFAIGFPKWILMNGWEPIESGRMWQKFGCTVMTTAELLELYKESLNQKL